MPEEKWSGPQPDEVCDICDGGPGNENQCGCGHKAFPSKRAFIEPAEKPKTNVRVEVRSVLWGRFSLSKPPEQKVKHHPSVEAAIAFIEGIEAGLRQEIIQGELTFWDKNDMLAGVYVRLAFQTNEDSERP